MRIVKRDVTESSSGSRRFTPDYIFNSIVNGQINGFSIEFSPFHIKRGFSKLRKNLLLTNGHGSGNILLFHKFLCKQVSIINILKDIHARVEGGNRYGTNTL